MDFADKIHQMRDLQKEIDRMTSALNLELLKSIEDENRKDVKLISDSPEIALVPYSVVMSSPGHILSAEHYLPGSQVEAVRHRINNCLHADQLCRAVKEMIETKKVKMRGGYTYLNETTLRVLRESELGQFVTDDNIKKEKE